VEGFPGKVAMLDFNHGHLLEKAFHPSGREGSSDQWKAKWRNKFGRGKGGRVSGPARGKGRRGEVASRRGKREKKNSCPHSKQKSPCVIWA